MKILMKSQPHSGRIIKFESDAFCIFKLKRNTNLKPICEIES